ncbi:hypothetical protein TGAMA5MH_08295 [Trichoderma gamsii]|uniref:Uncharacterized protein n=1 Tax=Trichoderma gamsii TaxID=398673 RepID=A0A2K0T2M7_9HYPO|nr:hypothetical protein TGAMA5MH_08295 [Trichoderma gamsii]
MDDDLEESASALLTTSQERVLAFVQEFLLRRAGQEHPFPTASLKDPSVVADYLAMKRLIDEGLLTVPPDTTIRPGCNGRWIGFRVPSYPFTHVSYPRDLYISDSGSTDRYAFTGTNTSSARSIEELWPRSTKDDEEWALECRVYEVMEARPYTAHPVWNSVAKRGRMRIPELEAIVEEAGKIEEADFETFEESLLHCDSDTRPGSAPLEDLPFQTVFYKLLSALHKLCGALEHEPLFSDMTDVRSWRQKMALEGVSSLRDAANAHTFIHFIDMIHFCMLAPEIPRCVTLLVQKHAEDLRELLRARQLAPKLKTLLNAHANRHNE